jgi:hypothetical protein
MFGPYIPDVRRIYWVNTALLDPDDEKPKRPVVVMRIPETTSGTVTVVVRSTTDKNGPKHDACPNTGLNEDGYFSRLRAVSCELWTPECVESCDLLLDEVTFSYVCLEFNL